MAIKTSLCQSQMVVPYEIIFDSKTTSLIRPLLGSLKGGLNSMILLYYTVELQWLEHLRDYENLFETGVVRATEGLLLSQVRRHNRDTLSIFFKMKVHCVFALESPQRGDSNEYTQYTISQYI